MEGKERRGRKGDRVEEERKKKYGNGRDEREKEWDGKRWDGVGKEG